MTWTAKTTFEHAGRKWAVSGTVESHGASAFFAEWSADIVELWPVEGDCSDREAHSPELDAAAANALIDYVAEDELRRGAA
ncbi:MAG TPA: hypothetical protein VL588_11395 [Bdellovibrionota bacterium]|jgi:hypothetical protein|nr:hypothetical protein [Bdellovibrionota bacterium]